MVGFTVKRDFLKNLRRTEEEAAGVSRVGFLSKSILYILLSSAD